MRRWFALAAVLLTALVVLVALRSDPPPSAPVDRGEAVESADGTSSKPHLRGRAVEEAAPVAHAPPTSVAAADGAPRLTLVGQVIDYEGDEDVGLAGVRVRLGRALSPAHGTAEAQDDQGGWFVSEAVTEFVAEAPTGADGRFAFDVADHRGWAIVAAKRGYGTAVYGTNGRDLLIRGTEAQIHVVLRRSEPVRLQVVDELHRPIPGATVAQYSWWCDRPPTAVVRTDEEGWFALPVTADDMLVVRADGHARHVEEEVLDRGNAPIVLTRPYAIGGVVVDDFGEPIEGAAVSAESDGTNLELPLRVTDAAGRFHWDDLSLDARSLEIKARAAGLSHGKAYVMPGRTDVRIVLSLPGGVAGRFVFPEGVDSQPVYVEARGPMNYFHSLAVSAPAFRLTGIPPGALSITGEARRPILVSGRTHTVAAFRGGVRVVRSPGLDLENVRIPLEPVPISYIVLRIVDGEGRPVAGAKHIASAPFGGASSREANDDGVNWSAVEVPPGTRTEFQAHGTLPVPDGRQSVCTGRLPVETVADPASPPLEVVLPHDGEPRAEFVQLTLFTERTDGVPLPADAGANWNVSLRGQSNVHARNPKRTPPGPGGGRWRGELTLDAGLDYEVLAWAGGCASGRFVLPASEPGEAEFVCRLAPESRIRGRLVTSAGRPAIRYAVRVEVHPPGALPVRETISPYDRAADGTFHLGGLPAGEARISVARPSGGTEETIVFETSATLPEAATLDLGDLVLDTLPLLRGVVRDEGGRPLAGLRVELFDVAPPDPSGQMWVRDGKWMHFVVTPTPYALSFTRGDGGYELAAPYRPNAVMRVSRGDEFAPYFAVLTEAMFDAPRQVRLEAPAQATVLIDDLRPDVEARSVTALEGASGHCLGTRRPSNAGEGAFQTRFRGLPIGRVRFQLVGARPDGSRWESDVWGTVVPGETTTVRFVREE